MKVFFKGQKDFCHADFDCFFVSECSVGNVKGRL